jgi:hypothetical protein
MKNLLLTTTLLGFFSLASCEEIPNKDYQITTEVRDDNNKLIQGANVEASRDVLIPESPIPLSKPIRINALTDQNGISKMNFLSVQTPRGVCISKEGYYLFTANTNWEQPFEFTGTTTTKVQATLRPIKNPIPMFAREKSGFEVAEFDEEYQFDFQVGELLPPHGKGVHPDIRVTMKGTRIDNGPDEHEDIDFQATIRFSNPLDGFIEFAVQPKDGAVGSSFISDYLAPESGYLPTLERKAVWGKARSLPGYWEYLNSLERKAYYFRVRTKTDADGKIISANYGKIYGPLTLVPILKNHAAFKNALKANFAVSELYFNPTSNDRNVEFDPKRNLLPDGNVQRP